MADVTLIGVKKPNPAVYAISGVLALGGIGLIVLGFRGGVSLGATGPLRPGETLDTLRSPNLDAAGQIVVSIGDPIAAQRPTARYSGPGRDTYTYFRILQQFGGQWVTVYGSGVAGVHVGPPSGPSALTEYYLVAPNEVQPPFAQCVAQSLCAFIWPGAEVSNICGRAPRPGPATAVLEVYQNQHLSGNAADADGFSSPTCNSRLPVFRREYPNKIMFA